MHQKAKHFQELIVWQKSHALVLKVYDATDSFPKSEIYGLVSQMRRSSASVPTNIAEGFSRSGKLDRMRFYNMADASLAEIKYQVILSHDLGFLSQELFASLTESANEVGRLLHGWMSTQ